MLMNVLVEAKSEYAQLDFRERMIKYGSPLEES